LINASFDLICTCDSKIFNIEVVSLQKLEN